MFFSRKTVGPSGTNDLSCVELVDFHFTPSPRKSDRLTLLHHDANLFDTSLFFTQCKLGVTFDGLPRGLFLGSTEARTLLVELVQWVLQFLLVFLERERRQLRWANIDTGFGFICEQFYLLLEVTVKQSVLRVLATSAVSTRCTYVNCLDSQEKHKRPSQDPTAERWDPTESRNLWTVN